MIINNITPDNAMWDIWLSMYQLPAITVADEMDIFSIIENNDTDFAELGKILSVETLGVESLVNVLISLNFIYKENGKLKLTEVSKTYLLPNSSFYWGAQLKGLYNNPQHARIISSIKNSIKTLDFDEATFTEMWEQGTITESAAQDFTDKMHATIYAPSIAAVKTGLFQDTKKLLDMGGGSGCFAASYLQKYPQHAASIFELPAVCGITRKYLSMLNMQNIEVISGNFFKDDWPCNHDGILFSQIFHDWPKKICAYLAKKAYETLPQDGAIYIHEMVLDEDKSSPLATACFNLLMYINHGSQQFTKNEIFSILISAGFKKPRIIKTFGYYSVITATK
jgi:acetylserotonin N-methyltransferase